VDRAQRIITSPQTEWPAIAVEPTTPAALYSGYIVPLALITPVCSLVSTVLFLHRTIFLGGVIAVTSFVLELVAVFVVALIADALAPSFNGVKDQTQALKWIAYAYTPRWIAGVLLLVPVLGSFLAFIGSLYSLYLLYLGAVPVIRVPAEKGIGYTVVVVIASIVLFVVIGIALAIIIGLLAVGTAISTGGIH
jgi:hypothetical protein